jgi:hypothetical protein
MEIENPIQPIQQTVPQLAVKYEIERCQKACCARGLWTVDDTKTQILVPLKDITIKALLDSGLATIDV